MAISVGINGFGRIGRLVLRHGLRRKDFSFAGINDPFLSPEYMCYLLRYDSVHGRFEGDLSYDEHHLIADGCRIHVFSASTPKEIDWKSCGAQTIVESTGRFTNLSDASGHLSSGASRVVITAPSKDAPTFVMGVNERTYSPSMTVVSNASCTTNCLAPLAKVVHDRIGILSGLMTTIHAATASQKIVDSPSGRDWRAGRAAFENIIPASTGAARAVGQVIPELDGKLTGIAMRIPTADVSVVDLTVNLARDTSYEEICDAIHTASETDMAGILGYTEDAVVSSDFLGDTRTSVFDAKAGMMLGPRLAKLVSWYDNEAGYSAKVLDLIAHMEAVSASADSSSPSGRISGVGIPHFHPMGAPTRR